VRGRGAAVKYLSHNASFHSKEKIAPSNRGIKQPHPCGRIAGPRSAKAAPGGLRRRKRRAVCWLIRSIRILTQFIALFLFI
jgi:hypothetical protein